MITKKQLEEIRRGLAVMGVRDTDLPDATNLTGAELVAIIQEGENRKVPIGDLFGEYLEGMLPYAVQGMSAYDVAVANGYTGTVQQWLASLQAAVEIDNNFVGGIYKVASAEEAKWLKESLAALQAIAITAENLDNSWSGDQNKPASAWETKWLKDHIGTGGSGTSVDIIDNLDSDDKNAALSAKQGKALKLLIESMVEAGNAIQNIYTWGEFKNVTISQPDVYYDTRGSIINLRTAYELWAKIQKLESDIADLNGSSSTVGATISLDPPYYTSSSSNGGEYSFGVSCANTWKVLSYDSGITIASPAGNVTGIGSVSFSYTQNQLTTTQTRKITVGIVGANTNRTAEFTLLQAANTSANVVDDENAPKVSASVSSISATSAGKIRKNGTFVDKIIIEIETKNTDSDWSVDQASSSWIGRSRFGSTLTLTIDENELVTDRTGSIIIKLDDEPNAAPISIIVTQDAYSETGTGTGTSTGTSQGGDTQPFSYGDLVIRNIEVPNDNIYPAMGANAVLCVISESEWQLISKPSWVSVDKYEGPAGETYLTISVESTESDRDDYIVVVNQTERASYHVVQSASISNYIKVVDRDELDHVNITSNGGNKSFKVYASGNWTATVDNADRSWIAAIGPKAQENGYEWKGTATGTSGEIIQWMSIAKNTQDKLTIDTGLHSVTIEGAYGGRFGGITGTLDGVSPSDAKSVLMVGQGAAVGPGILYVYFNPSEIDQNGGEVNLVFSAPRSMTWRVRKAALGISISRDATSSTFLPATISSWTPSGTETERTLGVTIDVQEAGLDTNTLSAVIVQKYVEAVNPDAGSGGTGGDVPSGGSQSGGSNSGSGGTEGSTSGGSGSVSGGGGSQSGGGGTSVNRTITLNPYSAPGQFNWYGGESGSFNVVCADQTTSWTASCNSSNVSITSNTGTGDGQVSFTVGEYTGGPTYWHSIKVTAEGGNTVSYSFSQGGIAAAANQAAGNTGSGGSSGNSGGSSTSSGSGSSSGSGASNGNSTGYLPGGANGIQYNGSVDGSSGGGDSGTTIDTLATISSSVSNIGLAPGYTSASAVITSDEAWKISSKPTWASVTPSSGPAGSTTITVAAGRVPTTSANGTIYAKGVDDSSSQMIMHVFWAGDSFDY